MNLLFSPVFTKVGRLRVRTGGLSERKQFDKYHIGYSHVHKVGIAIIEIILY
jgi:hypothetical protein